MSASSSVQSDALRRREYAAWVRVGILTIIGAYAVSILSRFWPGGRQPWGFWGSSVSDFAALGAGVVALFVHRRGYVRLSGMIVLAALWLELHYAAFSVGNMRTAGLPALPVLIVGTALFLGGPTAIVLAAVTAVTYPLAIELGARTLHFGGGITRADEHGVVILGVTLLATAIVMHFGLRSYRKVLGVARTNERKFGMLFEHAPDGILLLDAHDQIQEANPAAARLLGTGDEPLGGRRLDTVLEGLGVPPGAFRAVGTGSTSQRLTTGHELEITRTTLGPGDRAGGVQIMLHDITARRAMERQATELGKIIDQVLSEIYVFDPNTLQFEFVNHSARENLGYTPAEIEALRATDVNPGFERERIRAMLQGAYGRETGGVESTRAIHRRKDGSVYPVEVQVQRAVFAGRDVVVAFALDISARVTAEREHDRLRDHLHREQRARAIEQIAAGVADDVRELYRGVGEYAEALAAGGDLAVLQDRARALLAARERGEELARRLLTFARRTVHDPGALAVGAVLDEMQPLLTRMLGPAHHLSVEVLGPDLVRADRSQLEQVVVNLVANAHDAMPSGGIVRIVVGESSAADQAEAGASGASDRSVLIEVRDAGIGMDQETQRHIFEPFFTTKPRGHGTGLGLATVQSILNQNDARIEVQSRPGWGTRMRVYWPAAEEGPPQQA